MIKATNDPNGSAPRTADDGVLDVVVVGAGAAGLNAALLSERARRKVVVLDAGEPRNAPAAHMYGFLSRDGLAAAFAINTDLLDEDVDHAVEQRRAAVAGDGR
ncbi:FAD-binding protein [Actinoallomurus iriomotensis]|uniref:FAD-dependent oxidoreductase 2 FAD-binding domain-containing protein n=1 Tax=Actinoallomurus iriomotensis TaxID=478107 RepID=A0A9W6RE10_9ACTN|nr:FAD-binding protein [Actinoallomurus iriomotensis]GLY72342.1 hypothetical protein Airi01_006090 [Actinoallomurus iriomotensis]